jgi:type IV pilus assembly protein PilB
MANNFRTKKRLGDILVDAGVITDEQLVISLGEQKKVRGRKLGETLIDLEFTDEFEIANALKQQLQLDLVMLSGMRISDDIIKLISDQVVLRKYMLIPFAFQDNNPNVLRVAMADPMDLVAMDDISILTNLQIEPVISTPREIAAAIDRYYGNAEVQAVAAKYSREREQQNQADQEMEAAYAADVNSSPIVILVRSIIEQAVRQRASDIHIEPLENSLRVRFRVDGVLSEAMSYQSDLLAAIIARIKIMGDMDISEKRKPQDGRVTMIVDRQEFDIRVSILPTVYGEKVVMRLTAKKVLNKDKKELGLFESDMNKFNKLLAKPHGMILVTGPTGSGKSTTLYTVLSELNKDDVNIITVEDPVEANVNGISQVQVNAKVNMTFAAALRSILRQDPDIIMIGEIRDSETASIAVKASITGHLVVSTLHTNSAASTITRLIDMGIESYLIADATIGVIAQRLVRKLCSCKKSRYATMDEKALLEIDPSTEQLIYEPCGCGLCNDSGYYGRIGVYEIMPITPKLREIISKHGTADDISEVALSEGMNTLRMSVAKYVLDGTTTLSEMKRISFEE